MATTCAVCGQPCRGKCGKCGTRLCYLHKPKTARGKCMTCRSNTTTNLHVPTPAKQQPRQVRAAQPQTTRQRPASRMVPPYVPPAKPRKRIEDMTPEEALDEIRELRAELLAKQRREREYLDRRAARGTHTPTDEAYEKDQILEDRIVALIDGFERAVRKEFGI